MNTLYQGGHGRMIAPTPEGMNILESLGIYSDLEESEGVGEIARTCTQSYGIFPNWVSPLSQCYVPPLLFWPHGIDQCVIACWTMVNGWKGSSESEAWAVNGGEDDWIYPIDPRVALLDAAGV